MTNEKAIHIFIDGIKSIGIHNGIVRINLMRLDAEGNDDVVHQLSFPHSQALTLAKALDVIAK